MSHDALRQDLILSLGEIYQVRAFATLEDLLQGESRVLQYLAQHRSEDVYPSDLSRELRLSRSRITGALTSLRRKGLVETEHSEDDRRRVRVSITQAGLLLILEKMQQMEHYFDQMIAGIGVEDSTSLIRIIRRCEEVMTHE